MPGSINQVIRRKEFSATVTFTNILKVIAYIVYKYSKKLLNIKYNAKISMYFYKMSHHVLSHLVHPTTVTLSKSQWAIHKLISEFDKIDCDCLENQRAVFFGQ